MNTRKSSVEHDGVSPDDMDGSDAVSPAPEQKGARWPQKPYIVTVSLSFLVVSFASCILVAFTVGRAARLILIKRSHNTLYPSHDNGPAVYRGGESGGHTTTMKKTLLLPILMDGRKVPRTAYTSKNFDAVGSSSLFFDRAFHGFSVSSEETTTTAVWSEESDNDKNGFCIDRDDGTTTCNRSLDNKNVAATVRTEIKGSGDESESIAGDSEQYTGQHLLVDIKNVDGDFLNSERRLAQAIVDVVTELRLTLLSYHCHALSPNGVSCVGVLLQSHVAFHTWPDDGVITFDLFTRAWNQPLLPILGVIQRNLGVPVKRLPADMEGDVVEQPRMIWAYKTRGFDPESEENSGNLYHQERDLTRHLLGTMDLDLKEQLVSVKSPYQWIDVYDVIEPRFGSIASYHRSLSNDGSYESLHPELFEPDRRIFLDGILQSTKYGCEPYHEALVHPALFAHPSPRRVAIIGGGEGATLREVLKHNTVEKAVMVEIDEMMVKVSREHIPSWSNCSDLIGSADWCIEDPRSDVYYQDALAWFIDRFADESSNDNEDLKNDKPFDIIIMDALDPQDNVPFTEALYNNDVFMKAMYHGLTDDGILVMQLGESPFSKEPAETKAKHRTRAKLTKLLEAMGFQSMHVYEEAHSGFFAPWSYMLAFKDYKTRKYWYRNAAEVELAIHDRLKRTYSGMSPLKYFDGSTMQYYQVPPKAFETVYCKNEPIPDGCAELRSFQELSNAPMSSFEARASNVAGAGRGVFVTVDIPRGTHLGYEQGANFVLFPPFTFELIDKLYNEVDEAADLEAVSVYMNGYGWQSTVLGDTQISVDSSLLTFVNHGCNGTYNMGHDESNITEQTADPNVVPPDMVIRKTLPFDPVADRHLRQMMGGSDHTLHDLKAGEELLNNYLFFVGSEKDWPSYVMELRGECMGEKVGVVTEYEEHEVGDEQKDD